MIGVFDSGIGGLTVVKALRASLPDYDILYFGDTARTPYGNKSPATVIEYALQNTRFLLDRGAQIVVMACNTASSVATDAVAGQYDTALFEVTTPAVNAALEATRTGHIGVIGTRATVASGIYEKKIAALRPDARVHSAACPLLVPLVEEGWLKKPETAMIVKKYLHPLKVRRIDTLILGCTHYPLLTPLIQRKVGRRVRIIDSSVRVAAEVANFIENHPELAKRLSRNGRIQAAVSDITPQFEKIAGATLKCRVSLEAVKL